MIITRVGTATDVQPAQPAVAIRVVATGTSANPPAPGQPVAATAIDEAAVLRILYEEVRTALAARLGTRFDELPAPQPGPGKSPDRLDLTRLFAAVLETAATAGRTKARAPWPTLLAALDEGYGRALDQLRRLPAAPQSAPATLGQARDAAFTALETSALAAKAPPEAVARAVGGILEAFHGAIEDRVGRLPAGLVPAYDGGEPGEPVQLLQRALRFVASDSAFAMRATPSVLEAAVGDGAARALQALARLPAEPPGTRELVEDVRQILNRSIPPVEPPAAGSLPAAERDRAATPLLPAVRTLAAELTRAIAERHGQPPSSLPSLAGVADPLKAAAATLLAGATALLRLPAGDPRATPALLAAETVAAARRTVLQLPNGGAFEPGPRALVADIMAAGARLLAAAEAAAAPAATDPRTVLRLTSEAALALLRGYELPFRLDLAAGRGPRAGRGRTPGDEGIFGIESSDSEDEPATEGDGSAGAALAEFVKRNS